MKGRDGLAPGFVAGVSAKRETRRVAGLVADTERSILRRLDQVSRELEAVRAETQRRIVEARELIARLPDFAAIEAAPAAKGQSALAAIRAVADRHGLPMAAVSGNPRLNRIDGAARREALLAVAEACPAMMHDQLGLLFGGLSASRVMGILREARQARSARGELSPP